MKPLIILAVMLSLAAPAVAGPAPEAPAAQADWRREGIDERVKAGLTSLGWRLEDDGRALDPKTKAPAAKAVLAKAVLDLRQDARRAALEALNVMLDPNRPAELGDETRKQLLAQDLPPGLAAAVLDPNSDLSKTRAMAVAELDTVAAYFDGSRTMADRRAAASPVSAGTPGPRAELPYHSVLERSVGEKLQAASRSEIGRDPFGRTVLSRLDTAGKSDLPPILIEDQGGGVVAQYDYRRRAVVLDREGVLASVTGTVPPRQAAALRASLSTRAALLAYLEAHPEAVEAVVKENDVVLVHELTHAWQDRRDPVFREMARGNIPDVQPLEYEEEAYKTKNLYLRSKLRHDPASVRMDEEFADYVLMTHGIGSWRKNLFDDIATAAPARALTLESAGAVEAARLARVRARSVATGEEQQAKALDLLGLNRGQKELAKLQAAHTERMAALDPAIEGATTASFKDLGSYYLVQGLAAPRAPDRVSFLEKAARYAKASGDMALIEEVRKAKERKE